MRLILFVLTHWTLSFKFSHGFWEIDD